MHPNEIRRNGWSALVQTFSEGAFSTRLHPTWKIEYSGLDAGDTCQIVQLQVFDRFDEISHDKTKQLRRFPVAIRPRFPAPEDVEVTPSTVPRTVRITTGVP